MESSTSQHASHSPWLAQPPGPPMLYILLVMQIVIACLYPTCTVCVCKVTPLLLFILSQTQCMWVFSSIYVHKHNLIFVPLCLTDSQPPPLDPVDSAAEFSHTHFSRDDDLISLQVEPHRFACYLHIGAFHALSWENENLNQNDNFYLTIMV